MAGGLVGWSPEGPTFCGDAIADPLTGLTAARAVADSLARGGGELVEVSMAEVAATYAVVTPPDDGLVVGAYPLTPDVPARTLGADDGAVSALVANRVAAPC